MRPGWRWGLACGTLLLAAAASASAGMLAAGGSRAGAGARHGLVAGPFGRPAADPYSDSGGIPRDRLIDMVQKRFNARVVRVNLVESGGRRVYEMRLMSEQRVWNVRVDADTGQVLDGS